MHSNTSSCVGSAHNSSTPFSVLSIIGYSISFGVFQKYYTTHKGIEGSPEAVATVGTTLNGLMYLMMPLTFTLLTKYPRLRPYTGPAGLFITVASLIMSSYATQVWQLIASQGVLCAIVSLLRRDLTPVQEILMQFILPEHTFSNNH